MTIRCFWNVFLVFALVSPLSAVSSTRALSAKRFEWGTPEKPRARESVEFRMGYTLGTHKGWADAGTGFIELSGESGKTFQSLKRAELVFNPASLRTGNPDIDCHLLEALTLDYAQSDYPESHVCVNNQLPTDGKNTSRYSEIRFEADAQPLGNLMKGRLTIHGQTRDAVLALSDISQDDAKVSAQIESKLKLSDYGVIVKPFLFVTVSDDVTLLLNFKAVSK